MEGSGEESPSARQRAQGCVCEHVHTGAYELSCLCGQLLGSPSS